MRGPQRSWRTYVFAGWVLLGAGFAWSQTPATTVYPNTSLTACPSGQKLKHFFYYQDIPEFSGASWCKAAQANIDWANATDTVEWRKPYVMESCQAGVAWYYSHWTELHVVRYYSPAMRDIGMVCEADVCPVAPLVPVTDPDVLEFEDGKYRRDADMSRVTDAIKMGSACIVQKLRARGLSARLTSGYRPQAYQDHIREVWLKSMQLAGNTSPACSATKQAVLAEKKRHQLVREPVPISKHTSGRAIDIGSDVTAEPGNPLADQIAAECNMFRPEPHGDRVHFQPR